MKTYLVVLALVFSGQFALSAESFSPSRFDGHYKRQSFQFKNAQYATSQCYVNGHCDRVPFEHTDEEKHQILEGLCPSDLYIKGGLDRDFGGAMGRYTIDSDTSIIFLGPNPNPDINPNPKIIDYHAQVPFLIDQDWSMYKRGHFIFKAVAKALTSAEDVTRSHTEDSVTVKSADEIGSERNTFLKKNNDGSLILNREDFQRLLGHTPEDMSEAKCRYEAVNP